MRTNLKKEKGFTLVELLVVVAILGILLLLAMPTYMDSTKSSKIRTFESSFRSMMFVINSSLSGNNGSTNHITEDLDYILKNTSGNPGGATYVYDPATLTLTGTLPSSNFGGSDNYVLTYHAKTMQITQSPNPLPFGATKLSQN